MSSERAALEAAIDDAPDDASRYAVLGDWYQQHGDPRGELIAIQLAGAGATKAREEREAALLLSPGIRIAPTHRVQWRWGFVHTLQFELVRSDSWEEHREDWTTALLEPALTHPSCRFLRELLLDASPGDDVLRYLAAKAPRHLDALTLVTNELDFANVGGALQRLQRLRVLAQLTVPAKLDLPRLHELALSATALTVGGLDLVLESLPSLKKLTLSSLEAFDREALFPVTKTRLASLTLRGDLTTRAAVEALAESPLVETLEVLDVSRSGMTEEAVHRLLALQPKFTRLDSLVLGDFV